MQTLSQQIELFSGMNTGGEMMMGLLLVLLLDVALKGWAMWRAARMEMKWWFIGLLVINSLGIVPACFLLGTNAKYKEMLKNKLKTEVV